MMTTSSPLESWNEQESTAEAMIPLIGQLFRDNAVIVTLRGRELINKSAISLIKTHRFARRFDGAQLPLSETFPIISALTSLRLAPASIDVADLAFRYRTLGDGRPVQDFLREELAGIVDHAGDDQPEHRDVVLYGFGRIGRLVARLLLERQSDAGGLRLRAIVVRRGAPNDLVKRASLLRRDSIHGSFNGTITVDEDNETIIANGTAIKVIYSDSPSSVDYTAYGIRDAIVVDNTGRWRDEAGLSQHLECPGVARVLLTAPGKGALKNVVYGINDDMITAEDRIITAASCTTNAITPVLKVLNDDYGIVHGHMETVHAFTNDQNLTDNFHKGERRGRAAPLNLVITETGAATAVAKAVPELAGKLTGSSIRVPVPNVSLAILNLVLASDVEKDELNKHLQQISLRSHLSQQIDYVDSPEIVSTDFISSRHAGIVDGRATIARDKSVVLYVWYDNEFGYSRQVVRVLERMAGVDLPVFPPLAVPEPVRA